MYPSPQKMNADSQPCTGQKIDTGTVQNTMYRDQIWQLKTNNFQKKNNCF